MSTFMEIVFARVPQTNNNRIESRIKTNLIQNEADSHGTLVKFRQQGHVATTTLKLSEIKGKSHRYNQEMRK